MKPVVFSLLLVGFLMSSAFVIYFFSDSFPSEKALSTSQEPPLVSQGSESREQKLKEASGSAQNQTQVISIIKRALAKKNYEELLDAVSDSVLVRIEATSCCGQLSSSQAVERLKYLNRASGVWTFSEEDERVKAIKSFSQKYYSDEAIVGVSEDGLVVAFKLNQERKIHEISMASDYKLIIP